MRIGALLAAWGRPRGGDIGQALKGRSQHDLKAYYLSSIDVFRDLPRSEVERLEETTRMITCPRGKVVYRAGQSNEALFPLKTGRVQIVRESAEGKRLISAVLGPHTFFGEMTLVGQRLPQDTTAEAVDEALICVLSRKDLERLILEHPKVGIRFTSVPARLAGALLRLVETSEDRRRMPAIRSWRT